MGGLLWTFRGHDAEYFLGPVTLVFNSYRTYAEAFCSWTSGGRGFPPRGLPEVFALLWDHQVLFRQRHRFKRSKVKGRRRGLQRGLCLVRSRGSGFAQASDILYRRFRILARSYSAPGCSNRPPERASAILLRAGKPRRRLFPPARARLLRSRRLQISVSCGKRDNICPAWQRVSTLRGGTRDAFFPMAGPQLRSDAKFYFRARLPR